MNSKKLTANQTLAIPFITFKEGKGFQLNPDAQQFLSSLPENRQLGIVSIVGKYRTGKSFFVNRVLLDQKNSGFQVGPTINPCTKGLWLWKKTLKSENSEDMDVILIDTEGFGGMDENANHDSRIFLFSLLLSSYFIYNSTGSIDENAINTLNLIINLAKDIQTKSHGQNSEADGQQFPSFLWVVRDFTLKLVDKNESLITAKQYLENALEFQKGTSDAIENKNKIRRLLKHFFQNRDCCTMVRPTESERDLQRLDQIDNQLLRPEFVSQVKSIRQKIYSSVQPKSVNGKVLNGNLLVSLCKGYMETINKGHLPNVESAWFYVCRSEGLKAVHGATRELEREISQLLEQPIKSQNLQKSKEEIRSKVLSYFKKKAMNSEQGHPDLLEKLERRVEEQFEELNRKNSEKWTEVYRDTAESKLERLREKIYCEGYSSFNEFVREFEELKQEFDRETTEGDASEKWRHFNELSENIYKLAGETISEKINSNLLHEKQLLEQRITLKEQQVALSTQESAQEREQMQQRAAELEQENSRLRAFEQSTAQRISQYKAECQQVSARNQGLEDKLIETRQALEKLQRQQSSKSESESAAIKNELFGIKSGMEKERALFEMEKQYLNEEAERFKERCQQLESDNRKIRTENTRLSSELEELQASVEEKSQELELVRESNGCYAKKVEQLLLENSKKSELVGDHNEWLLEKSYLENQVAFLKNTMSENKKLHDALLVAFQNAVAEEGAGENEQSLDQLVEANQQMAGSLEACQHKHRQLEEKYSKLKEVKQLVKACSGMECGGCKELVPVKYFANHLSSCVRDSAQSGSNSRAVSSSNARTANSGVSNNKENLAQVEISVMQLVDESKKNGHSSYLVRVSPRGRQEHRKGEKQRREWTAVRKYREFKELHENLITEFPGIRYPESCGFLVEFNSLLGNSSTYSNAKRSGLAEERRRSIEQYLRDLSEISEVRESRLFAEFLGMESDGLKQQSSSHLKEEHNMMKKKASDKNFPENALFGNKMAD